MILTQNPFKSQHVGFCAILYDYKTILKVLDNFKRVRDNSTYQKYA